MRLLYDSALDRWRRVQALDLRLRESDSPDVRARLERKRQMAIHKFRRAYVEQRIRERVA